MSNTNRQCPKCKAWWPKNIEFCVCGGRLVVPLADAFDSVVDVFDYLSKTCSGEGKTKGDI